MGAKTAFSGEAAGHGASKGTAVAVAVVAALLWGRTKPSHKALQIILEH